MGHGDELVIADANFPAETVAKPKISLALVGLIVMHAMKPGEGFLLPGDE